MIILDHEDQQRQLQNIYEHHHQQHLGRTHGHRPNSSRNSYDNQRDSTLTDTTLTTTSSTTTLTTHDEDYKFSTNRQRHNHQISDDRPPYTSTDSLYLRFPEKVAARTETPLPNYETSEASDQFNLVSRRRSWDTMEEDRRRQERQRKLFSRKKGLCTFDAKMWRAIIYALGIYILLSILVGVPIAVIKTRDKHMKFFPSQFQEPGNSLSLSNANAWLSSQDVKCEVRLTPDGNTRGNVYKTSYLLDFAGSFFIRSNITSSTTFINTHSVGNLTVGINPDKTNLKVLFKVAIVASSRNLLHQMSVCFDDVGTDKGLFILASSPLHGSDFLNVQVQMLLPFMIGARLDNLVTYLPWFSHNFDDLESYIEFGNIVLEGSGYDVTSKSLKASAISIRNNYGSIVGNFYATNTISLDGIKGNITANVTLERDPLVLSPTYLSMNTGDGAIDSWVTLVAPPSVPAIPSTPYSFVANVQTFNGPLNLRVLAPVSSSSRGPSPMQLTVQNSEGATNVILDSSIEGSFTAQSKLDDVNVKMLNPPSSLDPEAKHRDWSLQKDQVLGNRVLGWFGWGNRPNPSDGKVQSQIRVLSSLSAITLQLGKHCKEKYD